MGDLLREASCLLVLRPSCHRYVWPRIGIPSQKVWTERLLIAFVDPARRKSRVSELRAPIDNNWERLDPRSARNYPAAPYREIKPMTHQNTGATGGSRLSIQSVVDGYQLAAFVLLTFTWSWGLFFLLIRPLDWVGTRPAQVVFAWGPLVGAALVTATSDDDLRAWVAQLIPSTGRIRWYGLALAVPLVLTDGSRVIVGLAGAPVTVADTTLTAFLTKFVVTLFLAGALEEFGWRGFVQPRLQERWSALTAALLIGVVWAVWHLPLAYQGAGAGYDAGAFVGLLIGLPAFSVVMAWLYNSTRGGLLFVMLFHAMINAPSPLVIANTAPQWAQAIGELGQIVILLGIPVALVMYYGRGYIAAVGPVPPIPGRGTDG